MEGYTTFPQETFEKYMQTFYPICVDLLSRDLNAEVRLALQALLRRVGECKLGIPPRPAQEFPGSPRSSFSHAVGKRRESKASR